jgi:hypothetical protein
MIFTLPDDSSLRNSSSLPALKQKIDEQLGKCQSDISTLPIALATDPSTEFLLRVTKFCDDFRAATFGEGHKSLAQHNRRQYNELKHDIYWTCPDFRPFEDYTRNRNLARDGDPAGYVGQPLDLTAVQKVIAGLVPSSRVPRKAYTDVLPAALLDGSYRAMSLSMQPRNSLR